MREWVRAARLMLSPWAVVGFSMVCLLVELVGLHNQWAVVRSWPSLVEAVDGSWLPLGVLVVGSAAGLSTLRWPQRELVASLPDPGGRTFAGPGLVVGALAALIHAVVALAMTGWGLLNNLPGSPRLWPVIGMLFGLLFCGLFGGAVVRLGAGSLSPLLAMGLYVGLLITMRSVGWGALFDLGGVSVVLVGLAPDTNAVLLRAGFLAAAAVLAWCAAAWGKGARRRLATYIVTGTLITSAFAASSALAGGFVATHVEWACSETPPRVCVSAEFKDRLGEYSEALGRLHAPAVELGLEEPASGYRQAVGPTPTSGSFNVDQRLRWSQLAFDLVQFSYPCSTEWNSTALDQADLVAAWLVDQASGVNDPHARIPTKEEARAALVSLRCRS